MVNKKTSTSWEPAESWYNECVGEKGHYYHQAMILPGTIRLLGIGPQFRGSLLDLGCGQGVLARQLPESVEYWGVDASPKLISAAKGQTKRKGCHFLSADATEPLPIEKRDFDAAALILSLQNMEHPKGAFSNAKEHLKKGGHLLIVLNHPCFRIPRQSAWGVDEASKIQYRRMNRYMSPLKIPIQTHPGKGEASSETVSFHYPLSSYMGWLAEEGFVLAGIEEWCSDKKSEGGRARMEDRARREFPLFLTLLAVRK